MRIDGCLLHNTDDWKTPSDMYLNFMKLGAVDCFPFHADYDEFERVYENKLLFVNPPYSKLKLIPSWIKKQLDHGCRVELLIPARTDTQYFFELLVLSPRIMFIKGRLHFNDCKNSAPFPFVILSFIPGGFKHEWYF